VARRGKRLERPPNPAGGIDRHMSDRGDLIVAIEVPQSPEERASHYLKVRDRESYEFALVSALDAHQPERARIHGHHRRPHHRNRRRMWHTMKRWILRLSSNRCSRWRIPAVGLRGSAPGSHRSAGPILWIGGQAGRGGRLRFVQVKPPQKSRAAALTGHALALVIERDKARLLGCIHDHLAQIAA
jgi:hypothetical protein